MPKTLDSDGARKLCERKDNYKQRLFLLKLTDKQHLQATNKKTLSTICPIPAGYLVLVQSTTKQSGRLDKHQHLIYGRQSIVTFTIWLCFSRQTNVLSKHSSPVLNEPKRKWIGFFRWSLSLWLARLFELLIPFVFFTCCCCCCWLQLPLNGWHREEEPHKRRDFLKRFEFYLVAKEQWKNSSPFRRNE